MAVDYEEGRRLLARHAMYRVEASERDLAEWFLDNAEALLNPDPWRPIEEAPKDGTVILSKWNDVPVFITWIPGFPASGSVRKTLFGKKSESQEATQDAWRVVTYSVRHSEWMVNANFAPYYPTHFREIKGPGQ